MRRNELKNMASLNRDKINEGHQIQTHNKEIKEVINTERMQEESDYRVMEKQLREQDRQKRQIYRDTLDH